MPKWTVTYHTITQESAEHGDYADHGFVTSGGWHTPHTVYMEDLAHCTTDYAREMHQSHYVFDTLKEALDYVTPQEDAGRWFDEVDPNTNYRTGEDEYRQLHPPVNITSSSYKRLKRALGVR
jgi:hypothetical protein